MLIQLGTAHDRRILFIKDSSYELVANGCVCLFAYMISFIPPIRKLTKESLVQTSSDITESLMSISRMMSQQVTQSEETISTLGKDWVLLSCPFQVTKINQSEVWTHLIQCCC